jgi:hypothetical protein
MMFLMYEYMHIVTPFFTTYYDQTCMQENVWVMVCIRWSNMVVLVNCDGNFYYDFYQLFCYLTREKKNACAIILIDN